MTFNFFASEDDLVELLRWIDSTGDFRFLEVGSKPDKPLRSFEAFPEDIWRVERKLDIVSIWPRKAGAEPIVRRVEFTPETQVKLGAKGRWVLESPAILRFHTVTLAAASSIGPVEFLYTTEKLLNRDLQFSQKQKAQVNWPELNTAVSVIKKRVRAIASGRWKSMPVLRQTAEILKKGEKELWYWGATGTI